MTHYLMNTYGNPQLAFEYGEGCHLYTPDGTQYLDALSGIAVCNLGHAHPAIKAAISAQSGTLIHTSNLYQIPLQHELAEKLGKDARSVSNAKKTGHAKTVIQLETAMDAMLAQLRPD